jgi:23S rRNA (pseudouridine1915-N3)-methyltransferase
MLYLVFVGGCEDPFREVERYYADRVKSSGVVKIGEVKEVKSLKGRAYITSPGGREMDEREFIGLVRDSYIEDISIAVGGPFGLPEGLKGTRISFSKLTFSHGLFRVMLLEQVYRALLTIKGSSYRK